MTDHAKALQLDVHARQVCQRNFVDHIALEAGAGTGKTATLIARILCWCLHLGWNKSATDLQQLVISPPTKQRIAQRVVSRVVAITFTDAAAAEMAERLGKALVSIGRANVVTDETVTGLYRSSLAELPDDEIKLRAKAILGVVDQMRISTIHSFCRGVLATYPLEAGLHPGFDVDAEGEKIDGIVRMVLLKDINESFNLAGPQLTERAMEYQQLYLEDIQSEQIYTVLKELLSQDILPNQVAYPFLSHQNILRSYKEFIDTIADTCQYIAKIPITKRSTHQLSQQELLELSDILAVGLRNSQTQENWWNDHHDDIRQWVDNAKHCIAHVRRWRKQPPAALVKTLSADESKRFCSLCVRCSQYLAVIGRYKPRVLFYGGRLLARLLTVARRELSRTGGISFDGILSYSSRLVRQNHEVRNDLCAGMDLLLVDEFQDTSQAQCDFVESLALDKALAYPKLFIVGDPKQSIYGWRSADIRSYFSFVQKVVSYSCPAGQGISLRLYQNFRSTPAILTEVRKCFSPVMLPVTDCQPPFVDLVPFATQEVYPWESGFAPVEHWIAWPGDALPTEANPVADPAVIGKITSPQSLDLEARALSWNLYQLCAEGGEKWSNCAVLLRSTTQIDIFVDAFRRYGIPYTVTRDRNYFRRREIIDAASMVRVILDPLDQVALVSFLRSGVVGLPDAALFVLWQHGFPGFIIEIDTLSDVAFEQEVKRIYDYLSEVDRVAFAVPGYADLVNWKDNFIYVIKVIRKLRKDLYRLSAAVLLHRIRHYLALELTEAASHHGEYRLANLDRFFLRLHKVLDEDDGDWSRVLQVIRRSIRESEDAEEAKPPEKNDVVQVMTIHKAKGLDFKHVYLMQTHCGPGFLPHSKTKLYVDRGGGQLHSDIHLLGTMTLGCVNHQSQSDDVEKYERVRLLYVALTRAKKRLVVSGKHPPVHRSKSQQDCKSLLELLGHRFCREVDSAACVPTPVNIADHFISKGRLHNYDGAQFVFPRPGYLQPKNIRGTENLASFKQIMNAESILQQRRVDAANIQARPNVDVLSSMSYLLKKKDEAILFSEGHYRAQALALENTLLQMLFNGEKVRLQKARKRLGNCAQGTVFREAQTLLTGLVPNINGFPAPNRKVIGRNISILLNVSGQVIRYTLPRLDEAENGEYVAIEYVFFSHVSYNGQHDVDVFGLLHKNRPLLINLAAKHLSEQFKCVVGAELWNFANNQIHEI